MLYVCSNCGFGTASWMGRCPDCGQWNTLKEQRGGKERKSKESVAKLSITPLSKTQSIVKGRKSTGIFEFDRVVGGGIIPGAVILLTGEPGIGKSTLLLQSLQNLTVLYISGEETAGQVKDRASRLKTDLSHFLFSDTLQVEGIIEGVEDLEKKIDIVVVDSVQTIYSKMIDSPSGAITQLRETTSQLIKMAKTKHIPIIIVGHVTKEGDIAGPKTLEHMVDVVLSFEGEKVSHFRVLRAQKNRFGSTEEIGIFEMKNEGLVAVDNPLAFLDQSNEKVSGKAIVGIIEGKRPLFFEIQALASNTMLAIPRRVVKGVDYNKVLLLLAVLRKNLNLSLDTFDIYVNVVGGVDIKSTAADLGIIAAIISSIKNVALPTKTLFIGEVGLLGEIRMIPFEEKIISEARRLTFQTVYSSKNIRTVKDLRKIFTP
ncbi:DNA repair protein RadA [Candidatus Roizmanbacteria bacterium]|nr:DNA repair protein RadA [Candidatus Roizmanbacteria bacterium]